jgi:hypothetical protein
MNSTDQTGLANRQTIAALVGIYERATADIRKAFAMIEAAELALCEAFDDGDHEHFRSVSIQGKYHNHRPDWDKPEEALESVNRQVWERLIDRMEVKRMMSVKAAEALDKQLSHDELPPISLQAIESMCAGFQKQAPDFLTEAVKEVFNFLRPRSNGREPRYKRNSEFEIPKRVVLEWMVTASHRGLRIEWEKDPYLVALENVLNSLDGKGTIAKTHRSAIYNALVEQGAHGETELFRYHAYCNRNLHLTFLREDLLLKLNAIAGGNRLHGEVRKAS